MLAVYDYPSQSDLPKILNRRLALACRVIDALSRSLVVDRGSLAVSSASLVCYSSSGSRLAYSIDRCGELLLSCRLGDLDQLSRYDRCEINIIGSAKVLGRGCMFVVGVRSWSDRESRYGAVDFTPFSAGEDRFYGFGEMFIPYRNVTAVRRLALASLYVARVRGVSLVVVGSVEDPMIVAGRSGFPSHVESVVSGDGYSRLRVSGIDLAVRSDILNIVDFERVVV